MRIADSALCFSERLLCLFSADQDQKIRYSSAIHPIRAHAPPALRRLGLDHPGDIEAAGDQLVHDVPQSPVPVDGGLHVGFISPGAEEWTPLEIVVDLSVQPSSFLIPDPPPDRSHEAGMIGDVQIGSAIKGSSRSLRFGSLSP